MARKLECGTARCNLVEKAPVASRPRGRGQIEAGSIKKPPAHPSGGDGQETMIGDHLAVTDYSDGASIGPGGGGYAGRLRRGTG